MNDFSKGIIAAVNHSGDSDSTGAVTGNILGALTAGFIYDISATLPYLFAAGSFLGVFALGMVLLSHRKKHTEEA